MGHPGWGGGTNPGLRSETRGTQSRGGVLQGAAHRYGGTFDAGLRAVVGGGVLVGLATTAGAAGDDGDLLAGVVLEERAFSGGLACGDDAELGAQTGHGDDAD